MYFKAGGLIATCLSFLCGAIRFAQVVSPNPNEAWFADPARNLAVHGHMGTTIFEGCGTWREGIDRYSYGIMPVFLLLQAAYYKLFGFGLMQLPFVAIARKLLIHPAAIPRQSRALTISAPAELAFKIRLDGQFIEDYRLGHFTGCHPNLFLTNAWQRCRSNEPQPIPPLSPAKSRPASNTNANSPTPTNNTKSGPESLTNPLCPSPSNATHTHSSTAANRRPTTFKRSQPSSPTSASSPFASPTIGAARISSPNTSMAASSRYNSKAG